MTRGTPAFLAASTRFRYPSVSVRELSPFVRAEWAVKPAALATTASARGSAVKARWSEAGVHEVGHHKIRHPEGFEFGAVAGSPNHGPDLRPFSSRPRTISDPRVPEAPTTVTILVAISCSPSQPC
jgi:hypothetical protein